MFEQFVFAQAQQPQTNPFLSFLPLILLLLVFYFLLIRPQQKRQRELQKLVDNLKKGDQIITAGGIIGTITSIQNDYVVIKCGDNEATKLEVLKSAITGLRGNA
jgi:preprotein translocase subunit YajC